MYIRKHLYLYALLMALLFTALLTSCGMMDYEGPDCTTHRRIRFTYDWNMLFADAFPHEVKTLTLYAFNSDGELVYQRAASTDSIIAKGYMDVDDMPAGVYKLQVWAEGEQRQPDSYVFGSIADNGSRSALTAAVNRTSADIDHDLTSLFYGTLDNADFSDMPKGGTREVTVNLMKDTENFRIVLQDQSGNTVNPSDFNFTITDDNGSLDADNNLVATGDTLTYHAWSLSNGEAGISSDSSQTITGLSAVVAELTTNRMVKGHNMRLHVTRASDGHEIINLPLIDVCLLVKGNYNRNMSDQEYLDRQDTWNLIFFISRENGEPYSWLAASIYVQQWRVVLQNVDM